MSPTSRRIAAALGCLLTALTLHAAPVADVGARWSAAQANAWYARQPWRVGSNYVPADAINQLEMWQADTFDAARIDEEFGWAERLGMNTMRIFLHDLLWQQDAPGFKQRIDTLLAIAARHKIKPLLVLFDSCWDPDPKLGAQHPPIPGVHNSGWVQSPGNAMRDPAQTARLERYVKDIVAAFANDPRILGWDIWNEPDNPGGGNYDAREPKDKFARVAALLPQAFAWARSARPTQPLTSGLWHDEDWSDPSTLNAIEKIQLDESDVVSFHSYDWPEKFVARIAQLKRYGRPLLCTEYMARGAGSTIDGVLPIAKRANVAMVNWGFVEGRTQTTLPWDSWQRPYTLAPPTVWFHDLLRADGTPYRVREADILRTLSNARKGQVPASALSADWANKAD